MKWVKHLTGTWDDEKVARLVKGGGIEGMAAYGLWWRVLEIVAGQMDGKSSVCSVTYDVSRWSLLLSLRGSHVRHWLEKLAVTTLLTAEWDGTEITVTIPNLLKYRDEYSAKSGQTPHKEGEIEGEGDIEGEKKTKKSGASRVRSVPPPDPIEKEIEEAASRIHIRHPKDRRCAYSVVVKSLRAIMHNYSKRHGMDKPTLLALIEKNHIQSCESLDWIEEDGRFANSLEKWLCPTLDRYMSAKARDSPRRQPTFAFPDRNQNRRDETLAMTKMLLRPTNEPAKSV